MALLAPALCSLLWVVAPGVVRSDEVSASDDGRWDGAIPFAEFGLGEEAAPEAQRAEPWPVQVFGSPTGRCSVSRDDSFEDRAAGLRVSDSRPADDDALAAYRTAEFVEHKVQLRKGDSFTTLMQLYDVSRSEALRWYTAARDSFDLARMKAGHQLSLFFRRGERGLAALEYAVDSVERVAVDRGAKGGLQARMATVPTWVEIRGISGTVGSSITRDCIGTSVPASIVHSLVKVYTGDVDFERLQRGDRYRVLYEVHVDEAGEIVRNGKIVAAEVVTREKPHVAIYFRDVDGSEGYYDDTGLARDLSGGTVSTFFPPLREGSMTSGFSSARRHPLYGFIRPHYGVDLAAPQGTPVRAIADGRVLFAHWHGQLGNAVRIEHGGSPSYASVYGHLSRIEEDVARGAWVRKGEVIGYVGRTGAATGNHLHLSVRCEGRYVDPLPVLRFGQPVAAHVSGDAFEAEKRGLLGQLASLAVDNPVHLTRLAMRK